MSPNGTTLNPGTGAPKPRWKNCVSVADMPASVRPWKVLRAARMPARPVRQRASLIAASTNSAPLLVKTTCARPGGATASNRCGQLALRRGDRRDRKLGTASRRDALQRLPYRRRIVAERNGAELGDEVGVANSVASTR